MRKAERQMEKVEKKSDKQYKQAKNVHYKHQANKTKRMMKKDARRARRMRNHQRSNPFYWTNSPYTPFRRMRRNFDPYILIRCSQIGMEQKNQKKSFFLIVLKLENYDGFRVFFQ